MEESSALLCSWKRIFAVVELEYRCRVIT